MNNLMNKIITDSVIASQLMMNIMTKILNRNNSIQSKMLIKMYN